MNKDKFTPEEIIKAIDGSFGNISQIAKKLNCCWKTAQTYINSDNEDIRTAFANEVERTLDHTDSLEMKCLKMGKEWAFKSIRKRLQKSSQIERNYYYENEESKQDEIIIVRKSTNKKDYPNE